MRYCINSDILNKHNISESEFLVLLINSKNINILETNKELINKGLALSNLYNSANLVLDSNIKDWINTIIVDSDTKVADKDADYIEIAEAIKNEYPKGKKPGTNYMWRDSTSVIAKKLKTLTIKFDFKFTKEQAIKATREYIKSFNGDYTYMQLLKYFILKNGASEECRSDFMSYIENEGQEDENNNNWTNSLV